MVGQHRRMGSIERRGADLVLWGLAFTSACQLGSAEKIFVPPTADEDPLLPQIELAVAGQLRAIHVETFGDEDDPVLLVLHGALGDYRALGLFEELADDYFVVMWDQRGNGLSQRVEEAEIDDQTSIEEIGAIKQQYAEDDAVSLIGYDFGGAYAAAYTGANPDDVAALVLIEPPPLNGQILEATHEDLIRQGANDKTLAQLQWQTEVVTPADHARMDYKAVVRLENGGVYNDSCSGADLPPLPVWRPGAYFDYVRTKQHRTGLNTYAFDYAAGLSAWDNEALIIGSSCSALNAGYQQTHHAPLLKDATVVQLEGTGHRLIVENPDAVLETVRGYLSGSR